MTKEVKMYRIINKDGKFSSGGESPTFTSSGKTWSHIGYLKSHLKQLDNPSIYDDCEIVEIKTIVNPVQDQLGTLLEQSLVKDLGNPNYYSNKDKNLIKKLCSRFVLYGKCYSTEFKELILSKSDIVDSYIPDYIIENFELFHNIGIKGCSDVQLAAIILTATKEQIDLYGL